MVNTEHKALVRLKLNQIQELPANKIVMEK